MRIELRDKPEEKKGPVAEIWLGKNSGGYLTLFYSIDGTLKDSLLYFDHDKDRLTVLTDVLGDIGYTLEPY